MKDEVKVKLHPVYIARLLYPFLTLLIIPVFKGVADYALKRTDTLTVSLTAELIILLVTVFFSYQRFRRVRLTVGREISVSKGYLFRTYYVIPADAARVIVIESNPLLSRLGIGKIKIYTEAGRGRKPEIDFPVRISDIDSMDRFTSPDIERVYKANLKSVLFMAAASSSAATGLLIAVPVVRTVTSILGKGVSEIIPRIADAASYAKQILLAGRYITAALALGYAVSFTVLLLKNCRFKVCSSDRLLTLKAGVFPKKAVTFNKDSVTVVEIKAALLMRLCGRCLVKYSVCGYGRQKGEIGLLLPSVRRCLADAEISELLPEIGMIRGGIKPSMRVAFSSVLISAAIIAATVAVGNALTEYYEEYSEFVRAAVIPVITVEAFYMTARLDSLAHGAATISDGFFRMRYKRRLSAVEIKCREENVERYCIIRHPFNRISGLCRLDVRLNGKNRDRASLPYLKYADVKELTGIK